ncbi:OLC1v1030610C1 [Oldenlandia corymbosa var. corymbosa]|uniref:OLC1v1030610C1 n=1 Tax=Oldenlandia corymbosa var. corymbosa TaxID=529605 RepID=A0AAV1CGD8_OLDCO|nr:OLC1v1030610C1 [Oldenlandia corymbosa var. corymbosa]
MNATYHWMNAYWLVSWRWKLDLIGQTGPPRVDFLERTLFNFISIHPSAPSKPLDVLDYLRSSILGPPTSQPPIQFWETKTPNIDKPEPFLSADVLHHLGFDFKSLPTRVGCRGIQCEYIWGGKVAVHLPFLEIVSLASLNVLIKSLADYERVPGSVHQPECTFYFRVMSQLVHSSDDVKILKSYRILGGVDLDSLPDILQPCYSYAPEYDDALCVMREIDNFKPLLSSFHKAKRSKDCTPSLSASILGVLGGFTSLGLASTVYGKLYS